MSYQCCLCGKPQVGFGNNPAPVEPLYDSSRGVGHPARRLDLSDDEATAQCCHECNARHVIPARIYRLRLSQR